MVGRLVFGRNAEPCVVSVEVGHDYAKDLGAKETTPERANAIEQTMPRAVNPPVWWFVLPGVPHMITAPQACESKWFGYTDGIGVPTMLFCMRRGSFFLLVIIRK